MKKMGKVFLAFLILLILFIPGAALRPNMLNARYPSQVDLVLDRINPFLRKETVYMAIKHFCKSGKSYAGEAYTTNNKPIKIKYHPIYDRHAGEVVKLVVKGQYVYQK